MTEEIETILVRSDLFWFSDGNVVVQAGQKQFKVHRGILSQASPIFRDMFSIPQPEDENNEDDGCTLVVLHDSERDVEILFTLLYKPLSVINRSNKPLNVVVATMLRLGKKYDIKVLWDQGIQAAKEDLPRFENDVFVFSNRSKNPTSVFRLAGEHSLRNLLHGAYWNLLSRYSTTGIIDFFSKIPGDMRHGHWMDEPAVLLQARESVRRWVMLNTYGWLKEMYSRPADCASPPLCNMRKSQLVLRLAQQDPQGLLSYAMTPLSEIKNMLTDLCPRCSSVWKTSHDTALKELWIDFSRSLVLIRN